MVVGLPAYFRPGPAWATVGAGSPAVRYVIANPSSGPGLSPDPAYVAAVAGVRAAGVEVLGYVSTRWGARPLDDVLGEVACYQAWYGISSIFFDEAASSRGALPYYRDLAAAVRVTPCAYVALNPGTVPDERYAALADLLVIFEGSDDAYRSWTPPPWQARYHRGRFWHLVHGTPPSRLLDVLQVAERRAAGVVHVSDGVLDNPWGQLPAYWNEALDAVCVANRSHGSAGR